MTRHACCIFSGVLALLLVGCGSSFHGNLPTIAAVEVSPMTRTLDPGATLQVSAVARDPQGAQVAGTQFTWQSSDPAVAEVTQSNATSAEVTAKAEGAATVVATAPNGRSGFVTVLVRGTTQPPPPPPSGLTFEKDIRPLAVACAGCHPALAPASGSMADYQNIIDKGLVKPGDPDGSSYYTKPSGKAPHSGGPIWGADAQKVADWIAAGAPER